MKTPRPRPERQIMRRQATIEVGGAQQRLDAAVSRRNLMTFNSLGPLRPGEDKFSEGRTQHHMTSSPRRPHRIGSAGRLALFHALVLALVLGAVVIALVRSFSASYESAAASAIGRQIDQFAVAASARPVTQNLRSFSVQFLQSHPLAAGDAVVVALIGAGLVVTGNTTPLIHDAVVSRWFAHPPAATVAYPATIGGVPMEIVGAPITSGTSAIGTFIAATDLSPFVAERSRVLNLSLAEGGVALLVGVASAFFLLRRLLRTIGAITATAAEIGSGPLEQRLGDQGTSDEVGELARTFDTMLDRLETAMDAQRRLLSDVSHQLRTPLTVVRGHLEVLGRTGVEDPTAVRETLDLVIDEIGLMANLIDRLLVLGRAMEPDLLELSRLELKEFLTGILQSVSVLAPRTFELGPTPAAEVYADRDQLRGAIVNLLDNAVRATASGGQIALGGEIDADSGDVRIVVEDSGTGIQPSERAAALERFARPGARESGGSGLGLAIAKAVAMSHGGSISIDQSPSLGGARVAIALPRASAVALAAN